MPRRFGGCRLSVCMTSPSPRRSARILGEPDTSSESPWNQATFADPLGADGALGRNPNQPGIEPRPGHPQESDHPCHGEVALLHQHQLERFPFVSEASWAKKSDAFFRKARSSFKSEFSLRNRSNSARSVSLRPPWPVSPAAALARKSWTHRPSVCSLRPSSRATVATVRPVLITSFTASSLYSGVNPRRVLPIMNILSYEVSTERGQGQRCQRRFTQFTRPVFPFCLLYTS